ncbi:MAG: hypothetical protein HYR60_16090 [Acidobacteria bacterium]|nr:hypothetical protein [Acidobacteriota bacterium]
MSRHTFLTLLLLAWLAAVLCPLDAPRHSDTTDRSWIFAINSAAARHAVWGRDLIWTWGPLGYLANPLPIGSNLSKATAAQAAAWAAMMLALGWLAWSGRAGALHLACFAAAATAARACFPLFLSFPELGIGAVGLDYYLVFVELLLLSIAGVVTAWAVPYALALAAAAVLCLVKLNAGVLALSAVAVFAAMKRSVRAALWAPPFVVGAYLLHSASFSDFFGYLRGGYELFSGYSMTMGLPGALADCYWAMALVLLTVLLGAVLRSRLLWMYLPPLFAAFKHGFVRQDSHVLLFYAFVAVPAGLLLLFADSARLRRKQTAAAALTMLLAWTLAVRPHLTERPRLAAPRSPEPSLESAPLSPAMRQLIGGQTVGFLFPSFAYASEERLNYTPFPVVQTYSAYTSWLDRRNAAQLVGGEPRYMVADWSAIDGRHPLADSPETWLALYQWYEVAMQGEHRLLLRRRDRPRFERVESLQRTRARPGDSIRLPDARGPLLLRIGLELNTRGKLAKILFRVPEVSMALWTASGRAHVFRVAPGVLGDRLLVNVLPGNLGDLARCLGGESWGEPIVRAALLGPGLRYFEPETEVEFLTIPGVELKMEDPRLPELSKLSSAGEGSIQATIDEVNSERPVEGRPLVIDRAQQNHLIIRGWAVDAAVKAPAAGAWATLYGRDYAASYGGDRPDVAAYFGQPNYRFSGYEAVLPLAETPRGRHELVLSFLTRDGKAYSTRKMQVELR